MKNVKPIQSSEYDKEVKTVKGIVVIKIWAPWCGPCKFLAPTMEEVAKENQDVKFVEINADEADKAFLSGLGIRAVPTILYIKDGEVKTTQFGNQNKPTILKAIEALK